MILRHNLKQSLSKVEKGEHHSDMSRFRRDNMGNTRDDDWGVDRGTLLKPKKEQYVDLSCFDIFSLFCRWRSWLFCYSQTRTVVWSVRRPGCSITRQTQQTSGNGLLQFPFRRIASRGQWWEVHGNSKNMAVRSMVSQNFSPKLSPTHSAFSGSLEDPIEELPATGHGSVPTNLYGVS